MTHADTPVTTALRPEKAWPVENVLFSAALVAQRLPWADLPARALGLGGLTREGLTRRLIAHLRGSRSGRPVRLRTPFGTFLVPLTRADATSLLAGADRAGALGPSSGLAPDGSRYGLSPHVAPPGAWDVLTGPESKELSTRVAEFLLPVLGARREDDSLAGDDWHHGMLRLSRRVVVGAAACEDTLLSEVVAAATASVGSRSYGAREAALRRRLGPYLAAPATDSLAGRLTARGHGEPETYRAVAHALALVSAATSTSALQALALLGAQAADDEARVPGKAWTADEALARALDRYPPLAATVHPVHAPVEADGLRVEPGTEVLYLPQLVRGQEEETAPEDPASALCHSASGCALARFAALVGREVVRGVTSAMRPVLRSPGFTANRLPDTLDPRTVVVALAPLGTLGGPAATAPVPAYGGSPASHGSLAQATADRLERHAESLAACAADADWNGSDKGEAFRMVLLGHADRCSEAAADVRRAGKRLSG